MFGDLECRPLESQLSAVSDAQVRHLEDRRPARELGSGGAVRRLGHSRSVDRRRVVRDLGGRHVGLLLLLHLRFRLRPTTGRTRTASVAGRTAARW